MDTMETAFLALVLVAFAAFCLGLLWGISCTKKVQKPGS